MNYTLAKMFEEAKLPEIPSWSHNVRIQHPYTKESMTPRWTQITGLRDAIHAPNSRYGLYDDMGSGKSLISYAFLSYYVGQGNKCLVIMPPKLLAQYRRNFLETFKSIDRYLSVEILYGTKAQTDKLVAEWYTTQTQPDIILVSFNFFRDNASLFNIMFPCDVIVGDEVKWLGNPDNKISMALERFMGKEGSKAALMMNGTPARSSLINLYGYIQFTNPWTYSGLPQFERMHVRKESFFIQRKNSKGQLREQKVSKIAGYNQEELLYKNLYKQGRRIELPPGLDPQVIPYEFSLSDKHQRLYRKLVKDKLLEFPDNTLIDITHSAAARHICMRAVSDCSQLKLAEESEVIKTTLELIEEADGKVLLMAYYQNTVEILLEATKGYNSVALYGGTSQAQAAKNREKFIHDPDCRVMIINYESGGVGVDGLQEVCHRGISVEPTGLVGDFQQAVKRLARPGQTKPVTIHCLMPEGTIYNRVIKDRMKAAQGIHSVVSRDKPMTKLELQAELLGEEVPDVEFEMDNF